MISWKQTDLSKSLIDEIKAEYIKTVKKLQIADIFKPVSNPKVASFQPQEIPLTMAQVYYIFI